LKLPALPASLRLAGVERTLALAGVLALFAAITGWLVWLQDDGSAAPSFVGPPRSDYVLSDFTMTALDAEGKLAFTVEAPRLAKHPWLGTFAIDEPRFHIIDGNGDAWNASSRSAWVRADAKELRLVEAVAADRVPSASSKPVALRTERLTALLDSNRMTSDTAVTITQPGSILRGVGLDADLKQNQFTLLADVHARFEKPGK
jgi:lipopolysaccharide export system protein LptC